MKITYEVFGHAYGITYTARWGECSGSGSTRAEAIENLEQAIINWHIING